MWMCDEGGASCAACSKTNVSLQGFVGRSPPLFFIGRLLIEHYPGKTDPPEVESFGPRLQPSSCRSGGPLQSWGPCRVER